APDVGVTTAWRAVVMSPGVPGNGKFGLDVSLVMVGVRAAATTCVTVFEGGLAEKFGLPPYTAEAVCEPAGRVESVRMATARPLITWRSTGGLAMPSTVNVT